MSSLGSLPMGLNTEFASIYQGVIQSNVMTLKARGLASFSGRDIGYLCAGMRTRPHSGAAGEQS